MTGLHTVAPDGDAAAARAVEPRFDVVVVGGGPAGATAAHDLARDGLSVALLDRAGRIKPCGGAIPPRLLRDFEIPRDLLVAEVNAARIISPSARVVDMPIDGTGFVGMVDRDVFDEWLRARAAEAGATRLTGTFEAIRRDGDGRPCVVYRTKDGREMRAAARIVIGADGANSQVAKAEVPGADRVRHVFAYHEIIRTPTEPLLEAKRCDVFYDGRLSPDFYAWVFPHGNTISIGTGSAKKGFSLRRAVADLRLRLGVEGADTVRREGAPIPLKPMKRWDNGRDVVLAGDAAGVVAPASGEGIYYAMLGGRLAATATKECLASGDVRALGLARKIFMKEHGTVFFVLGLLQTFWYRSDGMRERFVSMCRDKDVQKLTWDNYMNKRLTRQKPVAHVKIFFKDLGHLLGLVPKSH